jgi:hypothetical protein
MRLEDKGPRMPPPVLRAPLQGIAKEVRSWSGVIAATHWNTYRLAEVDGADFYVGDAELGHIHLNGEVHIPLTRSLCDVLVKRNLARHSPWSDSWIEFTCRTRADAEHARWLFRLSYDRIAGTPAAELRRRASQESVLEPEHLSA